MRVAYLDAFSGISGDMTVGALLSLGLPLELLREQLGAIDLHGYTVEATSCRVNGIGAVKFDVRLEAASADVAAPAPHDKGHAHGDETTPASHTHRHGEDDPQSAGHEPPHSHRAYRDIRALLKASALHPDAKALALRIFARLAEAEGKVHGIATDEVTFHEVGAVDSIVDIVGAAVGFAHLGIDRAFVSPLPGGSGIIRSQHGLLPVPAPATVEMLAGYDLRLGDGAGELVTPTGAAIVAALADPAPPPSLRVTAVGYGAGSRRLADRPNVLRIVLGEVEDGFGRDRLVSIETNIDDGNPEFFDYVFERLFAAGARDVYLTPLHMKKNRPGMMLSVLCEASVRDRLAGIIVSETSAIGVRFSTVERLTLPRELREVETEYGVVRVKVARAPDGTENLAPEFDDCARCARERQVPIKSVYQAAVAVAVGMRLGLDRG